MASWHADFFVGEWRVSPKLTNISKDGQTVRVKHKSMVVLACLADANGEVVSRNDIMDEVWPGMTVTDDVLTQSIVELRKAFDDDAKHPKVIETIPKVGFRLIAMVAPANVESAEETLANTVTESDLRSFAGPMVVTEPTGVLRTARRNWLAVIALVLAGIALWIQLGQQESPRQPVIVVEESSSIAVLPFVNMSDDPDNEYFSDGLSEEILNLLARIPELKVIGRTSSFAFKGQNEDLRVIGQTLGVKTVLEGSVQKSGERVRITVQLVDVSDGRQIWSDSYDRTMTDIFAVQDNVAAAIIDALQIHVGDVPTRGRPTENSEAYTLFLRARTLLNAQNGREAIVLLGRATELDPDFGEAYELLAYSYWQDAGASIGVAEAQRLSNDAASRALTINSDLVFAKALYQMTGAFNQADQTAIGAYEQAWRAQPGNTTPLRPLIYNLGNAGYHREAHRFAEQFVELDPLWSIAHYSLGETLYATGHTTEALTSLALAFELDNEYAKWFVPAVHLAEKHDDSAIAQTEAALERDGISDSSWVRDLVAGARDPVNGQAYLDRRIPQIVASMADEYAGEWQNILILWYLLFGFVDRYYELIFEAGPPKIWTDADIHMWKGTIFRHGGFTAHPKYLEAAESLGIVEIWEQRGPPDFCEKVEGEWLCE